MRMITLSAATLLIAAAPAVAQQRGEAEMPQKPKVTLKVGDKAPSIDIAHWIKGVEVDNEGEIATPDLNDGNVHVVEFWATWCGPCIAGMPHLSELQEQYADYDVTIIGVSNEALPVVSKFLAEKSRIDGKVNWERTRYTIATDPDGSVWDDYFKASGQNGIPTAFIVGKEGDIEWIGHPMSMDKPLEKIVRGEWDREEYAAQQKEREAWQKEISAAFMSENWDDAVTLLEQGATKFPDDADQLRMQQFMVLVGPAEQPDKGYQIARPLLDSFKDDSQALNQIAWYIVDDESVAKRDLDIAMKAAKRAVELTEQNDAAILDTLARVHYEKGDLTKAIEWQEKAVAKAQDNPMMKEQLEDALERYRDERDND